MTAFEGDYLDVDKLPSGPKSVVAWHIFSRSADYLDKDSQPNGDKSLVNWDSIGHLGDYLDLDDLRWGQFPTFAATTGTSSIAASAAALKVTRKESGRADGLAAVDTATTGRIRKAVVSPTGMSLVATAARTRSRDQSSVPNGLSSIAALRKNLATNPNAGAAITNWTAFAGGGTATIARATSVGGPVATTSAKVTFTANATAVGSGGVLCSAVAAGPLVYGASQVTISGYVRSNVSQRFAMRADPLKALGASLGATLGTDSLVAANTWTRLSYTFTMPDGAVFLNVGIYATTGTDAVTFATGNTIEAQGMLLEVSPSLNTYFDGATASCSWVGTANASMSVLTDKGVTSGTTDAVRSSKLAGTFAGTSRAWMAWKPDESSVPIGTSTISGISERSCDLAGSADGTSDVVGAENVVDLEGASTGSASLVAAIEVIYTNDNFAHATEVTTGGSGVVTQSTLDFTSETDEPGTTPSHSAWFKWTPTSDLNGQERSFDTFGSDYDTILFLYSTTVANPAFSDLTYITYNDDYVDGTSYVTFTVDSSLTYYAQASAFGTSIGGNLTFHYPIVKSLAGASTGTSDVVGAIESASGTVKDLAGDSTGTSAVVVAESRSSDLAATLTGESSVVAAETSSTAAIALAAASTGTSSVNVAESRLAELAGASIGAAVVVSAIQATGPGTFQVSVDQLSGAAPLTVTLSLITWPDGYWDGFFVDWGDGLPTYQYGVHHDSYSWRPGTGVPWPEPTFAYAAEGEYNVVATTYMNL